MCWFQAQMIVGIYRGLIPNRFARGVVALILLAITVLLFAFPYLVKPEVLEQGIGKGCNWGRCEIQQDNVQLVNIGTEERNGKK